MYDDHDDHDDHFKFLLYYTNLKKKLLSNYLWNILKGRRRHG